MTLSSVQRRVERTCKYCRAVRIILGSLTPGERAYLDESLASIPTLTKTPLLALERHLEADLAGLDALVGLAQPPESYISLVEGGAKEYPDQMMFVHKHYLDSLFRTRRATMPRWDRHPPHSMFGIDCAGRFPMPPGHIEFRLMEATLFEDLAMLWNECLAHEVPEPERAAVHDARIPIKRFNVLKRSTARAVFALLEGYMNGVAVDIRYTSQQGEFTQE